MTTSPSHRPVATLIALATAVTVALSGVALAAPAAAAPAYSAAVSSAPAVSALADDPQDTAPTTETPAPAPTEPGAGSPAPVASPEPGDAATDATAPDATAPTDASAPATPSSSSLAADAPAGGTIEVSGAQLQWAYSGYAQEGVFGPWRQWTSGAGVSLATIDGQSATGSASDAGRKFTAARFDGGAGTIDAVTGAGTIAWPAAGSWMLNAYPAMYGAPDETISQPILTIAEDGTGTLSFSAYLPAHNDIMYNTGMQPAVGPDRKILATFSSVTISDGVISVTPDFAGRAYQPEPDTSPWASCEGVGGSWPAEWINFLPTSVRAHYYTTSCAGLNLTKNPTVFTVNTLASAPVIATQPTATKTTLAASESFGLSVVASGNPISYQWQRSIGGGQWTDIVGQTDATLKSEAAPQDDNGSFRVVVGSGSAAVISDSVGPFTVTTAPLAVRSQPSDSLAGLGGTISFVAVATGSPRPTANWQRSTDGDNWTAVPAEFVIDRSTGGTTSDTSTFIAAAGLADAGKYRVVWDNGIESITSNVVTAEVLNEVPTVRAQPRNAVTAEGIDASFSASFDGLPAPTVQWQYSTNNGLTWSNWTGDGGTEGYFVVSAPAANLNGALFRLRGTAPAGVVYSDPATLTVQARTGVRGFDARVAYGELGVSAARVTSIGQGFTVPETGASTALRVALVTKENWQNGNYTVTTNHIVSTTVQRSSLVANGGVFVSHLAVAATRIQPGVEYGIVVISADADDRSFDAWFPIVEATTAPTVTVSAQETTIVTGSAAILTAATTGTPAPTLQWQRSDSSGGFSDLVGETGAELRLAGVTETAQYRAVATNSVSSVTSDAVTVTVVPQPVAPAFTQQPMSLIAPTQPATGDPIATFSVAVTGEPVPALQWERRAPGGSWIAIDGATTPELALSYGAADAGVQVRVVATNSAATTVSDVATLTLGDRPTVEPLAEGVTVTQGEPLVIDAAVAGTGVVVEWQTRANETADWITVADAETATLTVAAAHVRHGSQYRVVVSSPVPALPAGEPETVRSLPVQVNLLAPTVAPGDVADSQLTAENRIDLVSFDGTIATVAVPDTHASRYVGVWLHSEPISLGWHRAAADGIVSVALPAAAVPGDHRIVLVDDAGALIGWAAVTIAAAPVTGTPTTAGPGSPATATLPNTGAEIGPGLLAALVALLIGAAAVGATRVARTSRRRG